MSFDNIEKGTEGPVLFLPTDFNQQSLYSVVDILISTRVLKASDKLIWKYIFTCKTVCPEIIEPNGVYVRFFNATDMATGQRNPDFKVERPLKFSRQSKYNRLAKYKEIGLLIPHPVEHKHYRTATTSISKPAFPVIEDRRGEEQPARDSEFYAETNRRAKWAATNTDATYMSQTPLVTAGSLHVLANYIGRCVRISDRIKEKTFSTRFVVPGEHNAEPGELTITTSALDSSEVMLNDDVLLVDYIYSKIREILETNVEDIEFPLKNRFRFDLVSIQNDLGYGSSGNYRELLYKRMERISSTEFNVEASPNAKYVMAQLGFIDIDGEPYDSIKVNWFRIHGERKEDKQDEQSFQLDKKTKKNKVRYITISLPEYLHQRLNDTIQKKKNEPVLNMFGRDIELLRHPDAGTVWTFNNYLMRLLVEPGRQHGPVDLEEFLSRWYPSLRKTGSSPEESRKIIQKETRSFIKFLLHKERILYHQKLTLNARKEPRLELLYATMGKFLIQVTNKTPTRVKLSGIKYQISAIRMDASDTLIMNDRLSKLIEVPPLVEDSDFVPIAISVFDKVTRYKKPKGQ